MLFPNRSVNDAMRTGAGKHVLVIADTSPGGGIETYLSLLAIELSERGDLTSVVVEEKMLSPELKQDLGALEGVNVLALDTPLRSDRARKYCRKLAPSRDTGRSPRWDAVVISSGTPGGLLTHFPPSTRRIYLGHTYPRSIKNWLSGHVSGVISRASFQLATVSAYSAAQFASYWGLSANKIIVLPPPFTPSPNGVRKKLVPGNLRVVAVGSVEREKKPREFLETAEMLRQLSPETRFEFIWAGGGGLRKQMIEESEARGLAGVVSFPGRLPRPEILDLYSWADFVWHLSQRESLGLAPLEAACLGARVVSSGDGGLDEALGASNLIYRCAGGDGREAARIIWSAMATEPQTARRTPIGEIPPMKRNSEWSHAIGTLVGHSVQRAVN